MDIENFLLDSCKQLEIYLNKKQILQFMQYKDILLEWNKKMNLTAITEEKEIVIKHFADSISIIKAICQESDFSVIDVGSGAGFPGIPLKIISKETCRFTLLDSLNKRIHFLNETVDLLGLKNVNCVHGRAEDIGQDENYREKFDYCVSRAVANLAVLSEYCLPFVKTGGYFIASKGPQIEQELKEAQEAILFLGGKIENVIKVNISNSTIVHNLIVISKIKNTPSKYPRKAGKVNKNPIIKNR